MAMTDFGVGEGLKNNQWTDQSGTVTKKKNISQEGIDKIIYDIMSSDKGLANLGSLENTSGGFGSTDKTLMAQDLMVKLAGEIANVTAEDTQTTDMSNKNSDPLNRFFGEPKSMGDSSVICTELVRQGRISAEMKEAGHKYFVALSPETIRGYQFWAKPVAAKMRNSPKLTAFWLPIAAARYEWIVSGKKSFLGAVALYVLQPACFLIGSVLKLKDAFHARRNQQRTA